MTASAVVVSKPLYPVMVLARDLVSGDLLAIDPAAPLLLSAGTGELARAGQCRRGECGWIAAGRPVQVVRSVVVGGAK